MADDDFLRALGELTAEASAVEYAVAYLTVQARGHDRSALAQILKRVGGARTELDRLCKEVQPGSSEDASLRRDLVDLHKRMSRALWERNRLVHAVEVLKFSEGITDAERVMWHPKTDTELRIDADQIDHLVRELRGIAGMALRLTHRVREWGAGEKE
jgi:hypothetical protein